MTTVSTDLHQLTQRAIKLHTGKLGAQQPAADLSGVLAVTACCPPAAH
ncbi:hypothetical protein [Paracidovorax konjaci]|nr:hypothetical protein [Paracidovorax konjaci]